LKQDKGHEGEEMRRALGDHTQHYKRYAAPTYGAL